MSAQAAYARARAAVAHELTGLDGTNPEAVETAAGEVLGRLTRLGWRWVPQHAPEPARGPAAPPPVSWQAARDEVHAAAERARAEMEGKP